MEKDRKNKDLTEFDSELFNKIDEYGNNSYTDIATKLDYAERACTLLGIDYEMVSYIMAVCEARRCCFGVVGERFLRQRKPNFDEMEYLKALTQSSIPEEKREMVYTGVQNILNGKPANNEELLSLITNFAMEYANTYVGNKSKQVFMAMYFERLVKKSGEKGVLTAPKIDEHSRREKKSKLAIRHKQEKKVMLNMLYDYYREDSKNRIPQDFRRRVEGIPEEDVIAYYLASRTEKTIREQVKEHETKDNLEK